MNHSYLALTSAINSMGLPRVDIETIRLKLQGHGVLRRVMEADNTESNKRWKFEAVFDDILLDILNEGVAPDKLASYAPDKLASYCKLTRPSVNTCLKGLLYQDYQSRLPGGSIAKGETLT